MAFLVAKYQAMWTTRDRGATAVEYALMLSMIAAAIITAVTLLGQNLADFFNSVASSPPFSP